MCKSFSLAVLALMILIPSAVAYGQQEEAAPNESSKIVRVQDEQEASAMQQIQNRVSQYYIMAMDRYLDFMARPSTTAKMAKYQKNYFDALTEQGFSDEQAMAIITAAGSPLEAFQIATPR